MGRAANLEVKIVNQKCNEKIPRVQKCRELVYRSNSALISRPFFPLPTPTRRISWLFLFLSYLPVSFPYWSCFGGRPRQFHADQLLLDSRVALSLPGEVMPAKKSRWTYCSTNWFHFTPIIYRLINEYEFAKLARRANFNIVRALKVLLLQQVASSLYRGVKYFATLLWKLPGSQCKVSDAGTSRAGGFPCLDQTSRYMKNLKYWFPGHVVQSHAVQKVVLLPPNPRSRLIISFLATKVCCCCCCA